MPSPDRGWRPVRKGDLLPAFARTTDRSRATLLVAPHPEPCRACAAFVAELAGMASDLDEWAARVHRIDLDDDGRRKLGVRSDEAAVVLADRWGEVFEAATFDADHDFPTSRQLIESAKILDLSCGECNVPGKEWTEA